MTQEQQRIKIAEALGWKRHTVTEADPYTCTSCGATFNRSIWKHWEPAMKWCNHEDGPPEYADDLNEMHGAIMARLQGYEENFFHELSGVVNGDADPHWSDDRHWIVNATAAQRAEAFLKTLGLWEDDIPANAQGQESPTKIN